MARRRLVIGPYPRATLAVLLIALIAIPFGQAALRYVACPLIAGMALANGWGHVRIYRESRGPAKKVAQEYKDWKRNQT